jgi:hypothetical protein
MAREVKEKGTKGFLIWLHENQPEVWRAIAPKVEQRVRASQNYGAATIANNATLQGLGDAAPSIDFVNTPVDVSSMVDTYSTAIPTVNIPTIIDSTSQNATTPATSSWLSSLISGAAQAWSTVTQAQTQQKVTNIQLQRAQAGLAPLNIDPKTLGLSSTSSSGFSLSGNTMLYLGIGLAALLVLPKMFAKK